MDDENTTITTEYAGSTLYSALGCSPAQFRSLCTKLAYFIPSLLERLEAEVVVVRGTSGVSVAFGVYMLTDVPFVVARKSGENSHGGQISNVGERSREFSSYIILDDFVCSGRTVRGILDDLPDAECRGVLTYSSLMQAIRYPQDHAEDAVVKLLEDFDNTVAGLPAYTFKIRSKGRAKADGVDFLPLF